MPKTTTITKEIIIETAFEMVRREGFSVLSARNIAKKIGCSTQPIYWTYKNMDDLKSEVCQKALTYLPQNTHWAECVGNIELQSVFHRCPIALQNAFCMAIYR
ncbi:hypothetical protein CAPN005_21930 [Capnocytophaga cynodegmi]|nr:hypothetical protein CAPN005_21930 [Capnocytophaga cynodegmi]